MDFDDTAEEAVFRAEVRAWLEAHAPRRTADTVSSWVPTDADAESEAELIRRAKAWQRALYDGGWAGITWPKQHGGRGATAIEQLIFNQELARFEVPMGISAQAIWMAGPTIIVHGTAEQQERHLEPMLRGDEVWCQLFSEPGAGSDLAGLSTRAERDGEEFVVNGQKVWTSSAHYSDWAMLLARTNREVPKHQGITYFLLDMRTAGIEVRPLRQITGAAHFNEVFLTDVRVPVANVLGHVDDGWNVARTTLANERTLGGGNGQLFGEVLNLARLNRRTEDPLVRQDLVRLFVRQETMRYMGWRIQTAMSKGRDPGPVSSVLKLAASHQVAAVGELVTALQGAAATLFDYRAPATFHWQAHFLGQWSIRLGGGTDQVQRNIIGERVLGLPKDRQPERPDQGSARLAASLR